MGLVNVVKIVKIFKVIKDMEIHKQLTTIFTVNTIVNNRY